MADPIDDQNSGVHVYTRELVKALVCYSDFEWVLIKQKQAQLDVEQHLFTKSNHPLLDAPRMFFSIPRLLNTIGIDAVIEPAHFGPWNLKPEVKRITVIHDLTPIKFPQFHTWHSALLQQLFLKSILNRAQRIVVNSDSTKRDVVELVPTIADYVQRIYPGKNRQSDGESTVEISNEAPYFLVVGSIEPRKNGIRILESFEQLLQNSPLKVVPDLIFVGGKGWKNDAFHALLEKHKFKNHIKMKGFVPDDELKKLYHHAQALVYPSLYEGFGFPILEAFRQGCPVITSNNSSMPEVGGDAAFYIQPESTTELTQAMVSVLKMSKTEREQVQQKGLQQANLFSWEQFGDQWIKMLTELLY